MPTHTFHPLLDVIRYAHTRPSMSVYKFIIGRDDSADAVVKVLRRRVSSTHCVFDLIGSKRASLFDVSSNGVTVISNGVASTIPISTSTDQRTVDVKDGDIIALVRSDSQYDELSAQYMFRYDDVCPALEQVRNQLTRRRRVTDCVDCTCARLNV